MSGFCLFAGSALLGYAGGGVGRVARKGYTKLEQEKMEKVRREVQRKIDPEPEPSKESPTASMAATCLLLLLLGAAASSRRDY